MRLLIALLSTVLCRAQPACEPGGKLIPSEMLGSGELTASGLPRYKNATIVVSAHSVDLMSLDGTIDRICIDRVTSTGEGDGWMI